MSLIVRDLFGNRAYLPLAGTDPSYTVAAAVTTAAGTTATDLLIFGGAAGVSSRIKRMTLSALSPGTTAGAVTCQLIRQTAIGGGSSSAATPAKCDFNDPPAQTVVLTPGGVNTGTGAVVVWKDVLACTELAGARAVLEVNFAAALVKPPELVSATDYLVLRMTNVAVTEALAVNVNIILDETVVGATGET